MNVDLRAMIVEQLVEQLHSATGISIAGAGCTGKSTLACELVDRLRESGIEATILNLDGYFMPRAKRARLGLSAYNPQVFDLEHARQDIEILQNGGSVAANVYDQVTGELHAAGTLRLGDCLIIEGAPALHDPLLEVSPVRVFLDASAETLLENRRRREKALGFDDNSTILKFEGLRADYETHILPQRGHAHLSIEIDQCYRFTKAESLKI